MSWYLFAVLCFVPTLFFYYVGEEGVFTLNSLEMWQRQEFMSTVMYGAIGGGGGRPPLFNWLMIPIANFIGWENVLIASRIVTVSATISTSLIIGWLAHQLWRDKSISWLAALLYLVTADVMLDHGWQSYADPLFSMFVVLSIALAWGACLRNSYWLLGAAMVATFAAFLTKAFTVYVFFGISLLILISIADFRRFLLNPRAWGIYVFAVLMPLIWLKLGTHDAAQDTKMASDILEKLAVPNIADYLKRLVIYPAEMLIRLMPASFFIGYFIFRQRDIVLQHPAVRISLLIALFNFLPYLLSPQGGVRYVIPVFAFVVLAAAYLLMQKNSPFQIKKWLIVMLAIGFVARFLIFPYYQKTVRGENYAQMAKEIVAKYGQYPLYATNVSSVGLSVVANIDSMQSNRPALIWPPSDFKEGIVIAYSPNDVPGLLLRTLHINGDSVNLICRGAACTAEK
jgi:hypothetical protein